MTDRHGIGGRNILREPDKPVTPDLGPLDVAAVVQLALFQPPIRAGSGAEADNQ